MNPLRSNVGRRAARLRHAAFVAAGLVALSGAPGCKPLVHSGPQATTEVPAVDTDDTLSELRIPFALTLQVERIALRKPPLDDVVEEEVQAMRRHVRAMVGRRFHSLASETEGTVAKSKDNVDAASSAEAENRAWDRLVVEGLDLLAYLDLESGPRELAMVALGVLGKRLGEDAEYGSVPESEPIGTTDLVAELHERVAVLRLRHLGNDMAPRVYAALSQWASSGAPPDAVLLDLTDCLDGGPRGASSIANAFAPSRTAMGVEFRDPEKKTLSRRFFRESQAWSSQTYAKVPVFAAVSSRTSSIAEALVHALRAHRAARVIGVPTGGSGRLMERERLPWNAWFGFTVADLLGPDEKALRGRPVWPDACLTGSGVSQVAERSREAFTAVCGESPADVDWQSAVRYVRSVLDAESTPRGASFGSLEGGRHEG